MARFRDREKRLFPLENIQAVVSLFKLQLEKDDQPNLALLSILLGAVENLLTCNRSLTQPVQTDNSSVLEPIFPVLELSTVEALYSKFVSQIKGSVDLSQVKSSSFATRDLVKKVSDVIWSSLTRSYHKNRAHLQNLYSYLTGNKLDCFGVAFAVVAACQVLGFKDVHLALSEDHAWVTFGKDGTETAEVTWHGKGNEDKRGQPITVGVEEKSWLYLNGQPVRCTRAMEVAALVSGINPSINATTDSVELGSLQQQLLWLLYDMNHLQKYPMAIGNLGDLEEINPTSERPPCISLFQKAIESARTHYNDQHVYPYTYLGGYLYRNRCYKEALETWANAASAIRNYNYSREDEEIYKEFLEIANELIPHIIKVASAKDTKSSILRDPECFAQLLHFYDGICKWEEGSSTPVLHIGWAKHLVNTIAKFDAHVRCRVEIMLYSEGTHVKEESEKEKVPTQNNGTIKPPPPPPPETTGAVSVSSKAKESKAKESKAKENKNHQPEHHRRTPDFIKSLETRINPNEAPHPNILALAAACGENILNPEYLLGSGEPFSSSRSSSSSSLADCRDFLSSRSNGTSFPGMTMDSMLKAESPDELLQGHNLLHGSNVPSGGNAGGAPTTIEKERISRPKVVLHSEKMKGLKELLLADKLNGSAIQLQVTAQSQVQIVKRNRSFREMDFISSSGATRSTKRSRRE